MRKVRFSTIQHEVQSGTLIGIDYAQGAKVGRHVRVGVELKHRVPVEKGWVWTGKIVKCSKVLESKYLGAWINIQPDLDVMVLG